MAEKSTDTGSGRRGREPEDSLDRRGKAVLGNAGLDQPERVGPYKILERLGEGGMGTVFLAEQSKPIRRRVALKIIKLGMDTKEVVGRFEAERQALALMNHPNVAKVFDAGATEAGRPYFAMEHVPGVPITEYCDRERLTTKQRLDLFGQVCNAVQHAHQKGIIHRDIKPSNVLVMVQDGRPVPKVIDFGVAKAINQRLTEKTVFTEQGRLIGTPEYMSPEQAEMTAVDIDTRTDIYSLGVLLYELLVGTLPFEPKALREAGYAAVHRIIRESEPPKPSTRLSSLGEASSTISARRRSDPSTLARQIRGDLDWIVMRCLEKDRTRRYDTANALAMEIERHLNNEPVLAGPPSAAYRMRKFVRRNRGSVLAGGVATLTLVAGLAGTTTFALREQAAKKEATLRATELEKVADFQAEQLAGIDVPTMGVRLRASLLTKSRAAAERSKLLPEEIDARAAQLEELVAGLDFTGLALGALEENIFRRALTAIEKQFGDQPLVKARLLGTVAVTLADLGLLDAATAPQTEALAIRRAQLGNDHPHTLTAVNNMGVLLRSQGRYAEAEPYYEEALDSRRRVLGDDDPDTLISISNMGVLLRSLGRYAEAEPYYQEALDSHRRVLGSDHLDTLKAINNMGSLLQSLGRYAEAEQYFREALDSGRRVLGDDHPDTLNSISNLGVLLGSWGRYLEAEPYRREVLESSRRVLGDDHPLTLVSINNMADLLWNMGEFEEAEGYFREALESLRRVRGDDHQHTLTTISNLGNLLKSQGKLAEAEPYLREVLESSRRLFGDDGRDTLISIYDMGALLRAQGKFTQAIQRLAPAESAMRSAFTGDNAVRLGAFLSVLGRSRAAAGAFEAAEADLNEGYAILREVRGGPPELREDVLTGLVALYDAWHAAEPDNGYDAKAVEWRAKLKDWQATTQPATPASQPTSQAAPNDDG